MLAIYNETKTPWTVDTLSDSVVRISKKREKREGKQIVKKRAVSIIAYTRIFESFDDVKGQIAGAVMKKEPVVISGKMTAVIFNRKEFKPFITERDSNLKDVLLGSIFLQGRRVTGIKNDNTFTLEYFTLSSELSFITSFNTLGAALTIDLLNEKTGVTTVYKFTKTENGIEVSTKETDGRVKKSRVEIRPFRPSRPTYTILVDPRDREALEKTVDVEQHNILEITKDTYDGVINGLLAQNYRAVTLFANSNIAKETKEEARRYQRLADRLSKQFFTVFKLHLDAKVNKYKY